MKQEIVPNAEAVARRGAELIAAHAASAIRARGRFLLALSGGSTPVRMFQRLAGHAVSWDCVHLFQVDERAVPASDPDRNFAQLQTHLLRAVALPADHVHPMPMEEPDLTLAAARYAETLRDLGGVPPVLDLVHLGLGADGHTASLTPGDAALDVTDADVTASGVYQNHRRLTLTFPIINRARAILWLVAGADKASALARLCGGDSSIPASRVARSRAVLVADASAAGRLSR